MQTHFNIEMLAAALVPVLFVLLLGYWAGRHHNFNQDQASGFSTLALSYALPAALFVGMTKVSHEQLFQQGPLLLALLICYCLVYGIVYMLARRSKTLGSKGAAVVTLMVSFPAAPVYGVAVLKPLFGADSSVTVGIVSLICNLALTPVTLALLSAGPEPAASKTTPPQPAQAGKQPEQPKKKNNIVVKTIESPLVWAPLAGVLLVIFGVHVPALADDTLDLLGVSASGVAIFASGLVLAAHKITLSKEMWFISLGKVIAEPVFFLVLLLLFAVKGTIGNAALVATALPPVVLGVLLASKYKVAESLAAATLFVTSVAMIVVLPLWVWISTLLK